MGSCSIRSEVQGLEVIQQKEVTLKQMNTVKMNLIRESSKIEEKAKHEAESAGFLYRHPSSLISEFWGTSLTPSSFEVVIKELKRNESAKSKEVLIYSIQPCVRGQDLSPWSDGIHLLYFHMFTFFVINCQDPSPHVEWFKNLLLKLQAPVQDSYFTYYMHKHADLVPNPLFPDFGLELLKKIGINLDKAIPCHGYDNYQITYNYDYETGEYIRTEGPRIEIFADLGRPIEYGTIIYSVSTWLDTSSHVTAIAPPILSMVFGIERLTQVINKAASVWDLPSMNHIKINVINRLQIPTAFTLDLQHILELLIGLVGIAESVPADFRPGGKGPRDQLRKIVRLAVRKMHHLGISCNEMIETLAELCPDMRGALNRVAAWLDEQSTLLEKSRPMEG